MELRKRESIVAPLAVVVPVFAMGIVTVHLCEALTLFVWAVLFGVSLLVGVVMSRVRVAAVLVGVFAVGGLNTSLRNLDQAIPLNTPIETVVEVVSSQTAGRADVRVVEWGTAQGQTYRSNKLLKTTYSADTLLQVGTRLKCQLRVRPFSQGSYARLMSARGFAGRSHLEECCIVGHRTSPRSVAARVQSAAVGRLERLGLDPNDQTVAEAMVLGCRRGLKGELRDRYADTGNSHLLAVSGLHVAIILMLANLLLRWVVLFERGHRLLDIVVLVAVWLFAAATGMAASVVRATLMFSALQLSHSIGGSYRSGNILAAVAMVMLAIEPSLLRDVSFQFSFVAVAAILYWAVPLQRAMRTRSSVVNFLIANIVVGFAASLATMPLMSFWFGRVSLIGVALNPLVILLAYAIITFSLAASFLPASWTWVAKIAGAAAEMMNRSVAVAAEMRGATIDFQLDWWAIPIFYAVAIAITESIRYVARKKSLSLQKHQFKRRM